MNGKLAKSSHKAKFRDASMATTDCLCHDNDTTFEDTLPDTAHEDNDPTAANKLVGSAAYLGRGNHYGMSANVTVRYSKDNFKHDFNDL